MELLWKLKKLLWIAKLWYKSAKGYIFSQIFSHNYYNNRFNKFMTRHKVGEYIISKLYWDRILWIFS